MLSHRRMKLLTIGVFALFIIIWYYSGESRMVQNQEFYRSTVAAMDAHKDAKSLDKSTVSKPEEEEIKTNVNDKMEPAIPKNNENEMEEISIAGRTKITVPKNRNDQGNQEQHEKVADDHQEAKAELNSILKRSPIIIFSKSYCPHSAKAKTILLDKYSIVPPPYVVELDQHALGRQLQSLLAEKTGRRTVPNVLVSGRSIGGGDDVTALDEKDELASTLKTLAGKWIQEARRHEDDPSGN